MQRFGKFYARFLSLAKEEVTSIRDRLENLKEIKVTTSYPLLLRLFDAREAQDLSDVELEKCLGLIESFVIRRAVCGVPTNSLNKVFPQIAKSFPNTDYFGWLQRSLSSYSGNSRFPKDAEFASAFMSQPQYGRGSTRFILCRLEKAFNHKETVNLSTTTIEHVLPQTLNQAWRDELGTEAEKVHSTLVNTFGNLTLTGYNSELGNLSFLEKKTKLKHTHIELNRWILEQENWRASEIEKRAKEMLLVATQIWMSASDAITD
ncbi:HNH endonuclease family protein [Leptolyngbya sp. FACHB-17]|uniref:HNH endonuclease family protein n=1 Tax=unclassified Leptolyngbya TaxID=2650499 RepID=UPI002410FE1E|nr:HNH endonuclease family protein [Leptolyngbya sp. FACHB-17]